MADNIDFTAENWYTAADHMYNVADYMSTAKQAGQAALSFNAFGLLFSPLFLPAYTVAQTAADSMMGDGEAGCRQIGDNLRSVANQMITTSQGIASWMET